MIILDRITQIKESSENHFQLNLGMHPENLQYQSSEHVNGMRASTTSLHNSGQQFGAPAERGIMRGVLTPSALEKNIFCYNDPTVYSMLHKNGGQQLQHSHSTSSISSQPQATVQQHLISSSDNKYGGVPKRSDNYYNVTSSLVRNEPKSPLMNGASMRASTLPRNNNNGEALNEISVSFFLSHLCNHFKC